MNQYVMNRQILFYFYTSNMRLIFIMLYIDQPLYSKFASMQYTQIANDTFKVYPYRFVIVVMFCLVQLMNSVLLNTLTPVAQYLTIIYDKSPIIVNLGGLLFALMHPIFTFPAAYIIDTYGTRTGILIGSLLGVIGVSLRLLVNQNFAWVIIGQILAGIGRPFILNCQAKISANWFSSKTRGSVTQLLTLILNISLVVGIIIPSFVFGSYEPESNSSSQPVTNNYQQGREITFKLMLIQAIMGYICFGLNMLFQKNQPPTPASESGQIKRDSFFVAIPKLLKNKNFIYLLIAFGCFFGIFNGLSIVLSYLLKPWFFDQLPKAVSFVGGSPIISGILGVTIIGPMQRKSKTYKKWILICMAGSCVAMALFYPLLQTQSLFLASLISAFNSFFLIPLVPIMLQLSCELVFPVGQGTAVGLLFAMGNFSGFILGAILSVIVNGQGKGQSAGGLGFCFFIFCIGVLFAYLMKEQKNRQKSQREFSQRRSQISNRSSQISERQTIQFKQVQQSYLPPTIGKNDEILL